MARSDTGFACHKHDDLVSYELHHCWPRQYHGPDEDWNIVKICPNAHSDIHWLLERLLRGKPVDRPAYGPTIRAIAKRGYAEVLAYAEQVKPR